MRLTTSLPAVGLAALIAVTALTAHPAPATATDPTPAPSPTATADPSASPPPSSDPVPSPTASPDPSASPPPSSDPVPSPTASPDPSASPPPTDPPPTDPADPDPTLTATTTAPSLTRAERIRLRYQRAARIALRQRHDRYVAGGSGPNAFDCSGLVRFAYRKAHISSRLGGGHSARAMYRWAIRHGKLRRHHPRIGDVVIWGRGRHAGIYVGHGRAISALNPRQGIRITRLHALSDPFTAFIRTRP